MEFEDKSLICTLHTLKNIEFRLVLFLAVTTIRHLVDELFLASIPCGGREYGSFNVKRNKPVVLSPIQPCM